jgi:hypothetical protein
MPGGLIAKGGLICQLIRYEMWWQLRQLDHYSTSNAIKRVLPPRTMCSLLAALLPWQITQEEKELLKVARQINHRGACHVHPTPSALAHTSALY